MKNPLFWGGDASLLAVGVLNITNIYQEDYIRVAYCKYSKVNIYNLIKEPINYLLY